MVRIVFNILDRMIDKITIRYSHKVIQNNFTNNGDIMRPKNKDVIIKPMIEFDT
jgi:hypothetical protein